VLRFRDAFLTVAAHELKTPITALLGYAQLLQRRINRGVSSMREADRQAVEAIMRQTERLRDLVHELLDASRVQAGSLLPAEVSPVDLCRVARSVAEELRPTLQRHTVQVSCLSESLTVLANPMHLERVLQNLLDNAVKYSPAGGPVTVQLLQDGDSALIAVSDEGVGITEQDKSRIFDRFYRASHVGTDGISGFGVGLYIVQEIVRQYGGTVTVTSAQGKGSTFTVRLPLLPQGSPER
jgi:signal transduction histidine kinase